VVLRNPLLKPHVHEHPRLNCLLSAHTIIYDRFCQNATGSGLFQHPVITGLRIIKFT
jgi:hypothetical protein